MLKKATGTTMNLYINDSWRNTIDSNFIPPQALKVLKLLVFIFNVLKPLEIGGKITDRDCWPLDSDFSNIALVDRADRIAIPRAVKFFHRYHLMKGSSKFLALATLIFIVLLLFFFGYFLARTN
ncbi:unnamed protein product, partial [Gongylonema pulchrum]|uniref:Uncharacterized protein n=1 Tax=Gongylonema pulchrum TaxID=637853 RepID=A0A183EUL4_9BILA